MTLALLLLALGTFLLRFLPWRGERRVPTGQAGPALVVALFLVSAFSPPPSPEWLRAGLALLGTYLGLRLTGNLGVAVFLGAGLYGLLGALGF
ncbi:branched-chain amino acid transport [Thermus thermamylovorans]|uniref:Branched-chain amino acid transport n=1 Tax=Thermus thermamylovorans TaxID=2509362 RepID=A0A4Q9B182_9DEIN|nr:branched-chain amino acid transport [Thermus thermamylovorans]TBH17252.1 branched-chain amino acid transport [Thermus thermamylovorans]